MLCPVRKASVQTDSEMNVSPGTRKASDCLRARNTTYLLLLQMQQLDCAYFTARVTA